jgi:segregation and condensation protein A
MEEIHFELAADYLVMASTLTEIKSRLLLPVETEIEDEEDPRANLIKRLLEYQKYKNASEKIENLPRNYRDFYVVTHAIDTKKRNTIDLPDIKIEQLKLAFVDVLRRAEILSTHNILSETLSVRERMSSILSKLKDYDNIEFVELFNLKEGRLGVIVTFLALLELVKETLIDVIQNEAMSRIYIGLIK